jgi:predicted RNase H-like HicB family nuclease
MTLTVEVHDEDGVLWGQVVELPGCFATGETLDELTEALEEAIALYQADTQPAPVTKRRAHGRSGRYRVDRLTLVDAK